MILNRRQFNGNARRRELSDLGIPERIFPTALLSGRAAFFDHTANDQPGAKGTETLSKVIRSITESIQSGVFKGCRRLQGNQVRFLRDDTSAPFQFIASSGDKHTGSHSIQQPLTLYDKGPQTFEKVKVNQAILGLQDVGQLFPDTLDSQLLPPASRLLTWIFLYHIRPDGMIRSEFSLPVECKAMASNRCRITYWAERIILPEIPPEGSVFGEVTPPDPTMYDFDVMRRKE
jgi:hypothetical protein